MLSRRARRELGVVEKLQAAVVATEQNSAELGALGQRRARNCASGVDKGLECAAPGRFRARQFVGSVPTLRSSVSRTLCLHFVLLEVFAACTCRSVWVDMPDAELDSGNRQTKEILLT